MVNFLSLPHCSVCVFDFFFFSPQNSLIFGPYHIWEVSHWNWTYERERHLLYDSTMVWIHCSLVQKKTWKEGGFVVKKTVIHLIGQYSSLQGEDEKTVLNLHKSISFKTGHCLMHMARGTCCFFCLQVSNFSRKITCIENLWGDIGRGSSG